MTPHAPLPKLTVRAVRSVAVEVPMTYALGTSRVAVTKAPLLLIDVETEEGVTGHAYLFCYLPPAAGAIATMLDEVARTIKGDRIEPTALWTKLAQRFTLIGVQGIVRMAMSGFDIACWDALAIAAEMPLARLIGGVPKRVPAYNSCGLGLKSDPEAVADEAEKLVARGFHAVKLRLGYSTLAQDLAALRAVRRRVGEAIAIMVDYNQALDVAEALTRGRALDSEGIAWFEEPIRHDDYIGAAMLARELQAPVQLGENFSLPESMEVAIAAEAADLVMPDVERIGGVTGWRRAAALAAKHGKPMSSHLFPEVSAHLLAATPTAHWLEWVDWAEAIVEEPLVIENGEATVPTRPGNGLRWSMDAVACYRMG